MVCQIIIIYRPVLKNILHLQVEGVLLVAPSASSLSHRRREFLRAMKESLVVKHDQRATSHRIASSLEQVKVGGIMLCLI